MAAFSTLRRFGDNFGNVDVLRHVSFFLNQRDKFAMSFSNKGVRESLREMLPTATRYVTTVKPNLMSAFSSNNGVYHTPITLFKASSDYHTFCNLYRGMITHAGANEDRDYYGAWYEFHLKLVKGAARDRRGAIDLYLYDMSVKDEKFVVERLRDSVDTRLIDHHCLKYTPGIKDAIASNTSIVDVSAYSEVSVCRCNLFDSISARSTDIVKLHLIGGTCDDTVQMIADYCVDGVKNLSITTADSSSVMSSSIVDLICDAVAEVGILEILEIGNVVVDYEEWADGLMHALDTCPILSLRINETDFDEDCSEDMVHVLAKLKAADVKMTSCDFGDWGKPVFDALFSNTSITWLDLSFTKMGDGSIGPLVDMIKRGKLTRLAIGSCGVGQEGIREVLMATMHADSKLDFISIFGNDTDHPSVFDGMHGTSLRNIHVGELKHGTAAALADVFVATPTSCKVDTRDSDDCCNDGGGVWPWVTKSHVWYMSHEDFLED